MQGPWFDVKPPFNHPWFNTTFGGGVKPPMAGLTPLLGEVLNHSVVERFNTGLTLVEHWLNPSAFPRCSTTRNGDFSPPRALRVWKGLQEGL